MAYEGNAATQADQVSLTATLDWEPRTVLYGLRRDLVRLLQESTRGIPRRDRMRRLTAFVEEWRSLRERRLLSRLRTLVERGPDGSQRSDEAWDQEGIGPVLTALGKTLIFRNEGRRRRSFGVDSGRGPEALHEEPTTVSLTRRSL